MDEIKNILKYLKIKLIQMKLDKPKEKIKWHTGIEGVTLLDFFVCFLFFFFN